MKHRISALFAAAALSGCGFTDSSNRTGGDFLGSQGISVSSADSFHLKPASRSVQVVPLEGVPPLNSLDGLWVGGTSFDTVRTVVAFDVRSSNSAAFAFAAGSASAGFRLLRFPNLSSTMDSFPVRLRWVFVTDAENKLPALFVGVEPSTLGAEVLVDTVTMFRQYEFGVAMDSGSAGRILRRKALQGGGWLVALVDGAPVGKLVLVDQAPYLGSKDGVFPVSTFEGRPAHGSVEVRSANSPKQSLGAWIGGGRKLRLDWDADDLRRQAHQAMGTAVPVGPYDNGFEILQARAALGVASWSRQDSTLSASFATRSYVIRSQDSLVIPAGGQVALTLPTEVMSLTGITEAPVVGTKAFSSGATIWLMQGIDTVFVPTRLMIMSGQTAYCNHYWLRTDIADAIEYSYGSWLRVRIASVPGSSTSLNVTWTTYASASGGDPQTGADGIYRSAAILSAPNSTVQQEIRTALSRVLLNQAQKVQVEIVPLSPIGFWPWEAVTSPSVVDDISVLARVRDGKTF